ncbi:MAG TPA: hypothetical protein VJ032_12265, partial [Thermoanaerobaculia bacterium]|nr:hypothetical protein [Thermoanaerobaculia bacterium]
RLRVKVGDTIVKDDIDIRREGGVITIDVDAVRGNTLTIEPSADDEVQVERIEVLYGSAPRSEPRLRRPETRSGRAGWRQYPDEGRCIGGRECRQNGSRITIVLDDLPVRGIRFHARDDIGTRADGRLKVRIDETVIESYIDIERRGKTHELDVDDVYGSKLVIETANDDEVDVSDIEVLYGRDERGGHSRGSWKRGGGVFDEQGGCIGGDECGGTRAQIRIRLKDRPVQSVTFYAHDDVGTRAAGQLRVRIDDEIIEDYLDIRREGKSHTINGKKLTGRYLIIEPAADDEVVVEDIRVRYEQ